MGIEERRRQFKNLLGKIQQQPFKMQEKNKAVKKMQEFIVSYLGLCFIQGYRIFEHIDQNLVILNQLQYQHTADYLQSGCKRIHGQFRIIYMDFKQDLNENSQLRRQIFQQLLSNIEFLKTDEPQTANCALEVHFIFANNHKYSIVQEQQLRNFSCINLKDFYAKDYGIQTGKQPKIPDERIQGTQLHQLVQLFLKGSGIFRNPNHLTKQTIKYYRFSYDLRAVINTICLIMGKQILQNGYITVTSQKWMRRSTSRKFKRFDLLLRKQDKVCIIDWKFSKTQANQKIVTKMFARKNKEYFQLARKQYNADVELKFYCFHHKKQDNYHKFTCAHYHYEPQQFSLQSQEQSKDMPHEEALDMSNQSIQIQQINNIDVIDYDKNKQDEDQSNFFGNPFSKNKLPYQAEQWIKTKNNKKDKISLKDRFSIDISENIVHNHGGYANATFKQNNIPNKTFTTNYGTINANNDVLQKQSNNYGNGGNNKNPNNQQKQMCIIIDQQQQQKPQSIQPKPPIRNQIIYEILSDQLEVSPANQVQIETSQKSSISFSVIEIDD